jgi:hypothetical protein
MLTSALSAPHFHNEDAAFTYVEGHLWQHGPRIREAMSSNGLPPMGGPGQIVEADETEIAPSGKTHAPDRVKRSNNPRFLALVERRGAVRSKVRSMSEVRAAVRENLAPGSILHTDVAQAYKFFMPKGQHEAL